MIDKSSRNIINLIIGYNWVGNLKIDKLIIKVICDNFKGDEIDELTDKYSNINTPTFKKLLRAIEDTNDSNDFTKIILEERYDGFYIQKKYHDKKVSEKYSEAIKIVHEIGLKKNKGVLYEIFCKLFLEDLGITTELTKASNDKGIDILGSYKANFKDEIGQLVFNEDIYLLIQTKYFNKKIDTPVIRKLVGDSLFIRFSELEYINIKHNAFHLIVFSHKGYTKPAIEFAKKNKIKIFDSVSIAHIISEKPEKEWKCLSIKI